MGFRGNPTTCRNLPVQTWTGPRCWFPRQADEDRPHTGWKKVQSHEIVQVYGTVPMRGTLVTKLTCTGRYGSKCQKGYGRSHTFAMKTSQIYRWQNFELTIRHRRSEYIHTEDFFSIEFYPTLRVLNLLFHKHIDTYLGDFNVREFALPVSK